MHGLAAQSLLEGILARATSSYSSQKGSVGKAAELSSSVIVVVVVVIIVIVVIVVVVVIVIIVVIIVVF